MLKTPKNQSQQWTLSLDTRNEHIRDRLREDRYKSFKHIVGKDADQLIGPDKLLMTSPHNAWLNGTQKILAERRIIDAQILKAPYVMAVKEMGGKTLAFDGSMSNKAVAYGEKIKSKMFSPEGIEWIHSEKEMRFFTYFFEFDEWLPLGNYKDLVDEGLTRVTINRLLAFNHVLDARSEEQEFGFTPAETAITQTKLTYWALILSKGLGNNSEALAASVIKDIEADELEQTLLAQTAYSATSDRLFLDVVIKRNIDVDKKCIKLGCLPITWAAINGARDAVEALLPRSLRAYEDLPFLRTYKGFIEDANVLRWYIEILEAK